MTWSARLSYVDPQLTAPRAPDRAVADRESERLWQRVRAVRGRLRSLVVGEGLLWTALGGALSLASGLMVDAFLELPRGFRAAWLGVTGLGVLSLLVARVIRPWRSLPPDERLALLVERRRPELRSRLISALQLASRPASSPEAGAFVDRLVVDASGATADLDLRQAIPSDGLRRCARLVLPLLAALALAFALALPKSWVLLRRAWLEEIEIPRSTRLVQVTGDRTVGRGDDVTLEVVAEGVLPKTGRLTLLHGGGRVQNLALDPDPARPGRYLRTLANVPASFDYRIRVHDAESPGFRVEVLPRPVTTNLVITQHLPAYTRLAPRILDSGDLSLLRGSRIELRGTAGQSLASAALRLLGVDRTQPAAVEASDPSRYSAAFEVDSPSLTAFTVDLVDARGIPSRDSAVYAVDVVRDGPPQVRMILPARREELVTLRGTVLLAWEAKDDFGLARLQVCHQPAGSTSGPPHRIDLDLTGETNAVVRRRFEWRLDGIVPPVKEGAMIEFWVEAADFNSVDGPGIGRSERYLLRVVSEAEKRADLLGRAGDAIGRLGDVALGQERLNESLGRIILSKPSNP